MHILLKSQEKSERKEEKKIFEEILNKKYFIVLDLIFRSLFHF